MSETAILPPPMDLSVFGDPLPNAVGRAALVSSDDCVVELNGNSAKRLLWYGEDLIRAKLPSGTRVVYPKPAIKGLRDREAAIRYALEHPEQASPLRSQLRAGMKVTVAIDDISLPLPKMNRPDIRQSVLAELLAMFDRAGVDDYVILIANSFHRRMEPFEIRWSVGRKIFDACYPHRLHCHDGEDPNGMVELGETDRGEKVRINRRAAESDLLIYVNVNLVPMDGGHKSVSVGLCDYAALQAHHNPETIRASNSYFDHTRSPLTDSCNRMGQVINDKLNVFHIETALNNQMFDPKMEFFVKPEDRWNALDTSSFRIARIGLQSMPRRAKRKLLFSIPAPYKMIAIHAGATDAVHEKTLAYNYQQYCVPVEGQSDVALFGVPFVCPYNVNAPMNPLLVRCLTLGYFFNMYRGAPILKKGGRLHPHSPAVQRVQPLAPRCLSRVLPSLPDGDAGLGDTAAQVRGGIRARSAVPRYVQARLRLSRRPSVLHVVLGGERGGSLRTGDCRGCRGSRVSPRDGLGMRRLGRAGARNGGVLLGAQA